MHCHQGNVSRNNLVPGLHHADSQLHFLLYIWNRNSTFGIVLRLEPENIKEQYSVYHVLVSRSHHRKQCKRASKQEGREKKQADMDNN